MSPKSWINIEAAFEFLLEELEAELAHMDRIGVHSLKAHEYDDARDFTDQAAIVTDFRNDVRALRRKWQERAYWIEERENKLGIQAAWRQEYRLNRELRTPVAEYFDPVLAAVQLAGGAGGTDEIARQIPKLMKTLLKPADHEPLASVPTTPRWRNALLWARRDMVADGWLEPDTPSDVWQATEAGQWRRECAALERNAPPEAPAGSVPVLDSKGGSP